MKQYLLLRLGTAFIVALCLLGSVLAASAQESGTPQVMILQLDGPITPPSAGYLQRGLKEADDRNAEAVVIVLDTPGGSLGSMMDMVEAIRGSDVPVIVFVGPRGAKAASAGLLVTVAGHASAMAPETAIGASSPIGIQGEDLETTAEQKAMEYVSAEARSLAQRRGDQA